MRMVVDELHQTRRKGGHMHSHPAGILYYLSDAKLKITYPDGKTEVREAKSGTAVWSEPMTHAVAAGA